MNGKKRHKVEVDRRISCPVQNPVFISCSPCLCVSAEHALHYVEFARACWRIVNKSAPLARKEHEGKNERRSNIGREKVVASTEKWERVTFLNGRHVCLIFSSSSGLHCCHYYCHYHYESGWFSQSLQETLFCLSTPHSPKTLCSALPRSFFALRTLGCGYLSGASFSPLAYKSWGFDLKHPMCAGITITRKKT